MQRESIHEEYSYDGQYRFIVCRMSDYFEVWVQKNNRRLFGSGNLEQMLRMLNGHMYRTQV